MRSGSVADVPTVPACTHTGLLTTGLSQGAVTVENAKRAALRVPFGMTIDPENIIDIGNSLLSQYEEAFCTDFEANKQSVERLTDVESQRVRNRIAGYITRKMNGDV